MIQTVTVPAHLCLCMIHSTLVALKSEFHSWFGLLAQQLSQGLAIAVAVKQRLVLTRESSYTRYGSGQVRCRGEECAAAELAGAAGQPAGSAALGPRPLPGPAHPHSRPTPLFPGAHVPSRP